MAENTTPNIFEDAPSFDADGKKNQQDSTSNQNKEVNTASETKTSPEIQHQSTVAPTSTPIVSPNIPKIDLTPEELIYSISAYLDVLVCLPIMMQNNNEFVKFHVKQGIFVTIADAILLIFAGIFAGLFGPTLGDLVFFMLFMLPYLAAHGFLIYKTVRGEKYLIPIIGESIQKINIPFLSPKPKAASPIPNPSQQPNQATETKPGNTAV